MPGGDILALMSGEGTVVDDELHGDRRLGNLLERDGGRILRGAQGISDGNVGDAGDGNDGTDACFLYIHLIQSVKFIELADFYFFCLSGS